MSLSKNSTLAERFAWLLWLAAAGGVAVWIWALAHGDAARGWRMLLVNFLFFSSLAGGMVVWAAVTMASRGQWMGTVKRTALAGIGFAPVSLAMLALLMLGGKYWIPWFGDATLHNRAWLNAPFLFCRDGAALCLFWLIAAVFVRKAGDDRPARLAGWLIFVYCLVFSLLGFDMVMSLDPDWKSTLLGGYFFISALYIGAAGWTMTTILQGPGRTSSARYRDLGNLVLAFSLLTTYMMFAQLLVQWYENLPHETQFMVRRMNAVTQWPGVSAVLLGTVYLGPLLLFLIPAMKTRPAGLSLVAGLVLVFMWIERWWLVMPTLGEPARFGLADAALTAATAAVFILCVMGVQRRWPQRFAIDEPEIREDTGDVQ
jgi:hypothetical protein